MNDLISRQATIREYQKVCTGIKCDECPFLIKVNTEKGSHLITDCKLEAFLHNIPSAQRWIPVSERLPEEQQTVIASVDTHIYEEARFVDGRWWWAYEAGMDYWEEIEKDVTAWMPLPEPYKEEKYESHRK